MKTISRVPTDDELKERIEELEFEIEFLKNLLKMNDVGREEALIYMFGLLHFEKYRKKVR